jgi:hypothetical protein
MARIMNGTRLALIKPTTPIPNVETARCVVSGSR